MPRCAGNAAAGMRAGTAHIEPLQRPAIRPVAEHGARRPELVEAHIAEHDVAADKAELALQPLGAEDLAPDDRSAEAGGVRLDGIDDRIGGLAFFGIPITATRKLGRELLTE